MRVIHISYGGPEYWLGIEKPYRFEDHPYCGPIVLGKSGDPLESQPPESSRFWDHVNAWYAQGKRFKTIDGKRWCVYETQMQRARRANRINTTESRHD
ncbi:MAG: hypothetical protein KGJ38_08240 [Burkholderiaceae bacterium]|nr:hypothetical protein [Burkholderiaceae bacterium]